MPRMEIFARTEIGCVRGRNEDTFVVLDLTTGVTGVPGPNNTRTIDPPGTLVAVLDGMGGAAAGDVASAMAADGLVHAAKSTPIAQPGDAERMLLAAVTEANQAIASFTKKHPDKRGMGTTMTAALAMASNLVVVQVGDSRAYLRRGRVLQQLTMDQNVVGQMVAAGKLKPEEARHYKQRNVLLEAIGVQERVGPDIVHARIRAGDVLLLCSDGLTGPLDDRKILDIMLKHEDLVACCRALTEAACAHGGPDNVTVAMARFSGDDLGQPEGLEPIWFERRPAVA